MTDRTRAQPNLKAAIIFVCLSLALGLMFGLLLYRFGDYLLGGGALYELRERDTRWLALAIVLLPLAAWLGPRCPWLDGWLARAAGLKRPELWLAVIVVAVTALGSQTIHHGHPFATDEFMLQWQARIFLGGHIFAPLASEWADLSGALQPLFSHHDAARELWSSAYRPMTSALMALFGLAGLAFYTNAILAGLSVILVALLARRIWPGEPAAAGLAALLLAASHQALFMAMSQFSMTAHLFFALLWLNLFLRGGRWHIGAGLAGFAAVGLHQIYVHPAFIMPFMLSLLFQRRWPAAAGYFFWYLAVLAFWLYWRDIYGLLVPLESAAAAPGLGAAGGLAGTIVDLFGKHSVMDPLYWFSSFFRFLAWQDLLLLPLALIAVGGLRAAPRPVRLLAWSILTTALPHIVLSKYQLHGWGYRYLHVALGSVVVLGCYGWFRLRGQLGDEARVRTTRRALAAVLLAGLLVGVPLRAVQVESLVAPYANAGKHLRQQPVDLVFIDKWDVGWGLDLVRNDPFLRNRPLILAAGYMTPEALRQVCPGRSAMLFDHDNLRRFGIVRVPRKPAERAAARAKIRQTLLDAGCSLREAGGE